MRPALRLLIFLFVSALLAACASGPRRQINPPRASIQQLTVLADGQWQLSVRLQNFSNVPTTFQSVAAKLVIAGQEAGNISLSPAIAIGPESADVATTTLRPGIGAKLAVASALSSGSSVPYVISGRIMTVSPNGNHEFSFDSTLNPAPGLNGVLR